MPHEGGKKPAPSTPPDGGGDSSVREHGVDGPGTGRLQAERTLRTYLAALAAGEWGRACSQLSAATRSGLERLAAQAQERNGSGPTGCAQILHVLSAEGLQGASRGAGDVRVRSMRVGGAKAYVVYEDGAGPLSISMDREEGKWWVADVIGSPLG
jgi:hypothetical protein